MWYNKAVVKVFYNPKQVADAQSFSPSAMKPRFVVEAWQRLRGVNVEIVDFDPLTREDLALAHDREHVDAVLDCLKNNGFGNRLETVAASLPWTSGSMYAAARSALTTGGVAVSPTSGFHHAGYSYSGGFCTFNGLMVSAIKLLNEHSLHRVGIIDCDQHYGDGTDDIIRTLGLEEKVRHYTFGANRRPLPEYEDEWLDFYGNDVLPKFGDCDVVLYQAGADPHVDDPLGGLLTTDAMRKRDWLTFDRLKNLGVPVAWNLAGGYQRPLQKVIELHVNTMLECARVYGSE